MATKNNPGTYDCYAAAEPDEPIFVLRANDPSAPQLVRGWAFNRVQAIFGGHKPNTPDQWHKVSEALDCAQKMEMWHAAKYPRPAPVVVVAAAAGSEGESAAKETETKH